MSRFLAVAAAALLALLFGATPAAAHGAPTNPSSRSAACGAPGAAAASPACAAALDASPLLAEQWDNVRVADVNGRDRATIPDGQLCSAGLPDFRGLDLARADWPATPLTAGAAQSFGYVGTIPHQGTFRLYLTRPGYSPDRPLSWTDLESEPFLTVTDPPLRDGSYRFAGELPAGHSGRALIYTVWQNSSTPDTYYSCSDVDLGSTAAAAAGPPAAAPPAPAPAPPPAPSSNGTLVVGAGVLLAALAAAAALVTRRARRH